MFIIINIKKTTYFLCDWLQLSWDWTVYNQTVCNQIIPVNQSQLKLHYKWTNHKLLYNHHSNDNQVSKPEILNKTVNAFHQLVALSKILRKGNYLNSQSSNFVDPLSPPTTTNGVYFVMYFYFLVCTWWRIVWLHCCQGQT